MSSVPEPIRDEAGARAVADAARAEGRLALDLEFLWERTYAPIPCMVQVALADEVFLLDPIEGAPLEPISELLGDPAVRIIVHAPSADLTLMSLHGAPDPTSLEDVQLVAGFVGLGAGQSLGALVERVLGVRLSKTEGYTDWSRRPLSSAQLAYAADDVRHLLPLADELARRAEARGRTAWVAEEMQRRYGPGARFAPDPEESWRKVKGGGRLSPTDRAVLRELAAWREREARRRDRPVGWLMPDRTLLELARRRPATRDAVTKERGVPDRMRPAEVDAIIDAVRAGEAAEPISMPPAPPPEMQHRMDVLGPLGQVLVTARAAGAGLAPSLLATRDEIESFLLAGLNGGGDGMPLADGWRREIAGEALLELAAGRLALAPGAERPYLREIPR
jgi:ribonuclease D